MSDSEKLDKILLLVVRYMDIDGGHHKQYALDQVVRIIMGDNYEEFVRINSEDELPWDEGIAG